MTAFLTSVLNLTQKYANQLLNLFLLLHDSFLHIVALFREQLIPLHLIRHLLIPYRYLLPQFRYMLYLQIILLVDLKLGLKILIKGLLLLLVLILEPFQLLVQLVLLVPHLRQRLLQVYFLFHHRRLLQFLLQQLGAEILDDLFVFGRLLQKLILVAYTHRHGQVVNEVR